MNGRTFDVESFFSSRSFAVTLCALLGLKLDLFRFDLDSDNLGPVRFGLTLFGLAWPGLFLLCILTSLLQY